MTDIEEETPNTDIAVRNTRYNFEQYRDITTFDDALALVQETQGQVAESKNLLGDGFELVTKEQKARLTGVPFLILDWTFIKSKDYGGTEYVSARVVTRSGAKLILNDSGTGIYTQLKQVTDSHEGDHPAFVVPKGLRASTYKIVNVDGQESKATTYYLTTH